MNMKKNPITKKILRAFLLVCTGSLIAGSTAMLINMMNIRTLTLESGNNIGLVAADNGRESLRNLTFYDIAELVQAKSDTIDLQFKTMAATVALLKYSIEQIYIHREAYRPAVIPNMYQVAPGELRMHWFIESGIINGTTHTEADLARSGLREETYLLGNIEPLAEAIVKDIPDIFTIYISTKSGQNIQYDSDADLKAAFPGEVRLQERPWYKIARDTNSLYISEAYSDMAGRGLTISMSSPYHGRSGELMGVVGMDIKIKDLDMTIRETVVRDTGYAVLINNYAGEGQDESRIVSAPGLNEQNENDIAAFLGGNTGKILVDMRDLPSGRAYSSFGTGGKERWVYIIWAPIELTNWRLAYVVPEKDILAPATALYNEITGMTATATNRADGFVRLAILISGFLMCVIIFLTAWTARLIAGRIARPIIALTGSVKKIGDGNLDYHSEIRTGDEIEELSLSFERMTVELKNYIENLRHITAEKERIGAELNVATRIQASMLPRIFPPFPERNEFDVYASMLPAKEVGGDFFDFFFIDEDTLVVLIADVSGKGVPAALFMVIAKTLIKNNAQHGLSPKEVFETVNNLLCIDNEESMFVTAFMGYLDISSGKFTCVNAGHNPPLIKQGDAFEWFRTKRGLVLGSMEDMFYKEDETLLRQGDMLYLYTDGITEAMDSERKLFGEYRLMEAAMAYKDADLREFTCSIKREIDAFAGDAEQADDITMLVLKYYGGDKEGKELKIEARLENLDMVLGFVREQLEKAHCSPKIEDLISIAVEEIFVNIAHYAYTPETGMVTIRVAASGDEIRFEFKDSGKPYNPLEKADPDISVPVDDRPIGGLGIFMVKKLMDSVEYRHDGGQNLLILKKTVL
jgi:sigma-B regulation protein RsbU (phosphoserine phosphatase)